MNQKIRIALMLGVTVAVLLLPVLTSEAQAQDGCLAFHAVMQEKLPADFHLRDGDTWGGQVYAVLGQEFLAGYVSGNDGPQVKPGTTIIATGGTYKFDFGEDGSFTTQANTSTAPLIPGVAIPLFGTFRNSEMITEGEGRFQFASGQLVQSGPFIVYLDSSGPPPKGRYNGEVTGNICGVQPAEQ